MLVRKADGLRRTGEHRADVYPAGFQQSRAEGHTVGGIVIAADGKHRQAPRRQLGEEPVQQAHSLGRGNGLVVQVACQQYPVHRVGIQQGKNLLQDVFLVLQHGKLAHPLAQMQVGKMRKTQKRTPPFKKLLLLLYSRAGAGRNPLSHGLSP